MRFAKVSIIILFLLPVTTFGIIGTHPLQDSAKQSNLRAWQEAQKYSSNRIIKSRGEYETFSLGIHSQYGIKMISWSRWSQTNMDERAKWKDKRAGLNAGLAVKVSVLCNVLREVYKSDCKFYPSMVRTSGKGVLSRSQHRIDQGAKAVDLFIKTSLREEAFRMASNLNLTGLGVYTRHLNMLHVDTGNRRAWTHGYRRGVFVTLDNSHTRRPLYPPSDVLRYLGVSKGVVDAFGNGSVQYNSSDEALSGILVDYKTNSPDIYAPGVSVIESPIYNIAPEDWGLSGEEGEVLYELFYRPSRRAFNEKKTSPPAKDDFTYTIVELREEQVPKRSWIQSFVL